MSRQKRSTFPRLAPCVLVLILLLCGLLLVATACEELGSDSATADPPTTTVTTADPADPLSVLYGTWEGTYTPDAAWGEDGPISNPPFTLGEPVNMRMELHPWSAEEAGYGTIGAGGLYPARVASLSIEGEQVTIIAVTEESGLDDLMGAFDLTLQGETLTGADERAPEVPSGWISSSGTVYLTRTAPWVPGASPETTASTAAPAPGGDDGGADDGGGDDAGEVDTEPDIGIADDDPAPRTLTLGAADNGGHSTIRVGDTVVVHFEFLPGSNIADIFCQSTSSVILFNFAGSSTQDPATHYYYVFSMSFEAMAPGTADIITRPMRADGTLFQHWRHYFVVED